MSGSSVRVEPRSRKDIRAVASAFRAFFGLKNPKLPIMSLLENELPKVHEKFYLGVAEKGELKKCHGLTVPNKGVIYLREDIYDGAMNGVGRDRFTACHELGHLLLHQDVSFAKQASSAPLKRYEDSEWQANCFAGELLICSKHVNKCTSCSEIQEVFGVSKEAAETMISVYRHENILNW